MNTKKPAAAPYTTGEEIFNAITHGLGAVFGVVALTLMLVRAINYGNAVIVASTAVYGATMILVFLMSTLYHAIPHPRAKNWLKLADHVAIYLLIAGTYTPYLAITLKDRGVWLLVTIWSIAVLGLFFKLFFLQRFKKLSVIVYLAMGWLSVLVVAELNDALPPPAMWLLAIGGLVYTLGVVFYVAKQVRYSHGIWHLFVIGGVVCHWCSVYLFVMPSN